VGPHGGFDLVAVAALADDLESRPWSQDAAQAGATNG
jgi:hypothetical protein